IFAGSICASENRGKMIGTLRPVPLFHGLGCPLRRFIIMTIIAGIRSTKLHTQIGSGHTEAMIPTVIYFHIITPRHVTTNALRGFGIDLMPEMLECIVLGLMALHTEGIIRDIRFKLKAVRIVAVVTLHSLFIEHPAL